MKLDEPRPRPEPRPRQGQDWGQTQVHAQNHGLNDDRGQQLAALHSPRLRFRRNVMDCRKAGIRNLHVSRETRFGPGPRQGQANLTKLPHFAQQSAPAGRPSRPLCGNAPQLWRDGPAGGKIPRQPTPRTCFFRYQGTSTRSPACQPGPCHSPKAVNRHKKMAPARGGGHSQSA